MALDALGVEVRENSQNIKQIIVVCVCALGTIIFAMLCYWVGSVSGKVDQLQIQQSAMESTLIAEGKASEDRRKGIEKDHASFNAWLSRIENKLDVLTEKVYSNR